MDGDVFCRRKNQNPNEEHVTIHDETYRKTKFSGFFWPQPGFFQFVNCTPTSDAVVDSADPSHTFPSISHLSLVIK